MPLTENYRKTKREKKKPCLFTTFSPSQQNQQKMRGKRVERLLLTAARPCPPASSVLRHRLSLLDGGGGSADEEQVRLEALRCRCC